MRFNYFLLNLAVVMILVLGLGLLQTTIWYQLFYPVTSPNFWLPVVVYLSLYRSLRSSLVSIYVVGLFLAAMTSQPIYLLFLSLIFLYFSTQIIRVKFFWSGASYFVIVSTVAVPVYHFLDWVFSLNFEINYLRSPRLGAWFFEIIMMPVIAPVLFAIMRKIDELTRLQGPNEYGVETL